MTDRIEITVVGAGVIGSAVARELARAGHDVVVLEKNSGVTQGENQSSRNSGVIHAGLYYDRETRPLKAALCPQGNELLYQFCEKHDVPAIRTGKLVVAASPEQQSVLETYLDRAAQNGVPARLIGSGEIRDMEPNVRAVAALDLPTTGIIDPTALVHRLYALASNHGARFVTQTEVTGIQSSPDGLLVEIKYRDGVVDSFPTERIVNCAGLYSDDIARMVDPASTYQIDPLRGEAMKFYRHKRPELELKGRNVYPTPKKVSTSQGTYFTVGLHLTPTLDFDPQGRPVFGPVVTVGPLNIPAGHKEDYGGEYRPDAEFHGPVAGFFPGLREDDLEPHQAGIQARLVDHQDWVIETCRSEPRCLNLLGIDSPGLTGCLAIARTVRDMIDT